MLERYGHGGDLITAREAFGRTEEGFIDFSSNMNPFGPPPVVQELCGRFWETIAQYPDPAVRELRRKLALRHGVPVESILVGNGAAELIELAVRMLRPQVTGLARPSFSEYEEAVEKAGGRIRDVQLRAEHGFVLQEDDLLPALSETDLIFLGHPNNPTGRLLEPQLVRRVLERKRTVILDEAFIDFSPDEETYSFARGAASSRKLFVIRSMTKFFAIPGIRLGYIVAHPDHIESMRRLQVQWSVNGLAQQIGAAVLEEREYADRTRRWLTGERAYLTAELEKLGLRVTPSDTNFLLFSLPERVGLGARDVQERLGRAGILVRDASLFKGLNKSYCRIAVKQRADNDRLISALERCFRRSDT